MNSKDCVKVNVVVTGAAGFLGSYFISSLDKKKYKIYAIDSKKVSLDGVVALESNINNVNKFITKLPSRIDYFFHFAAIKDINVCEKDYSQAYFNNTYLTLKILFALRSRIKHLIYTSSCSVYGNNKLPNSEECIPSPLSFYAVSKLCAENYALTFSRIFNIPTVIVRLFNIYGKWEKDDNTYQGVITTFIKRLNHHQPLIIYGTGKQTRDFIYVQDVCELFKLMIKKFPSQSYLNIGTGKQTTILRLSTILQKALKRKVQIKFLSPKKYEIYRSVADNTKLRKLYPSFEFTLLEEGLRRLLQ